jgi:hypothetical protein
MKNYYVIFLNTNQIENIGYLAIYNTEVALRYMLTANSILQIILKKYALNNFKTL